MNGQNNEELRIELPQGRYPQDKQVSRRESNQIRRSGDGCNYIPTYSAAELDEYRISSQKPSVKKFVGRSLELTGRYIMSKLLASAVIGVALYALLMFLGVPYAIAWALAAAIGNAIPIVGQWIGMAVSIGGVWIVTKDWKMALYTVIALIVLQVLDEFVISPLIVGKAMSIKPLLIMVIMLAAGSFCGVWGVILAVPAAAVVKAAYEVFWLGRRRKDDNQQQ